MNKCEACPLVTLCRSERAETLAENSRHARALGEYSEAEKTFIDELQGHSGEEEVIFRTRVQKELVVGRSTDRLLIVTRIAANYLEQAKILVQNCPRGPMQERGNQATCRSSEAGVVEKGMQRARLLRRVL